MIRIKQNRCGYTGYTCDVSTALELSDALLGDLSCSIYGDTSTDNILNGFHSIPVNIKGMVNTIDRFVVISGGTIIQAPEKECKETLNPNDEGGFIDAYTNYKDAFNRPGQTTSSTIVDNYYTLEHPKDSDSELYYLNEAPIACFVSDDTTETEYVLGPGILEPMLPVQTAPINTNLPTAIDTTIDGILLVLSRLYVASGGQAIPTYPEIKGIIDILNVSNSEGVCEQFKISLTRGRAMHEDDEDHDTLKYAIKGGTIHVNGQALAVSDLADISFPGVSCSLVALQAFIKVEATPNTASSPVTFTASIEVLKSASPYLQSSRSVVYIPLGGVRTISNVGNASDGASTYYLHQIYQDNCYTDISLIHTAENGFIRLSGGTTHAEVMSYESATCDEDAEDTTGDTTEDTTEDTTGE